MSSQTATYGQVAFPLSNTCSALYCVQFGHLASACSTRILYRRTLDNIPTDSSTVQKTLTFSTYTDNIAEYVGHCHCEVFCAPYGHCHCEVFCAPYGHCHCEVFCAPYGHCHSAPYRRSAVQMNVLSPRTASHQIDAAASHSCHFNTVLYSRSYSEC